MARLYQGTKAAKTLGRVQAGMPGIGRNSRLFGTGHGRGILNIRGFRIGWAKGKKHELVFRVGVRGSHVNATLARTGTRFS